MIGHSLALAALVAMTAGAVSAQQGRACGPRDTVLEKLERKYGETRQSVGLAANDQMVEVYASSATGTWTILMTSPAGVTCLMATGQAFAEWKDAEGTGDPA